MIRRVALALLLAVSACNGFDTGLNPRPDVSKEQGPLVAPPAGVVSGLANPSAGSISLRCVPRATGLESECRPL